MIKPFIEQSVFYHYYQKYFKKLFMTSFTNILNTFWLNYCVVSEKHIPHNMLSWGYFRNGRQTWLSTLCWYRSKKRLWDRCFCVFVNFVKFLRTPFLQNTSGGCFCWYLVTDTPINIHFSCTKIYLGYFLIFNLLLYDI